MVTYYVLEMFFLNGNKVRKHYRTNTREMAMQMAKREYPDAIKIEYSHEWSE